MELAACRRARLAFCPHATAAKAKVLQAENQQFECTSLVHGPRSSRARKLTSQGQCDVQGMPACRKAIDRLIDTSARAGGTGEAKAHADHRIVKLARRRT